MTASMANAVPMPKVSGMAPSEPPPSSKAISVPARTGPRNTDSCAVPWTMALPVWSRSVPRSFGMIAD